MGTLFEVENAHICSDFLRHLGSVQLHITVISLHKLCSLSREKSLFSTTCDIQTFSVISLNVIVFLFEDRLSSTFTSIANRFYPVVFPLILVPFPAYYHTKTFLVTYRHFVFLFLFLFNFHFLFLPVFTQGRRLRQRPLVRCRRC